MKFSKTLAASLCSLVLATGCASTKMTPQTPTADERINVSLSEMCSDGLEKHIIFLPDTNEIIDLTKYAELGAVYHDIEKLSGILREHDNVIEAHCHVVTYESILKISEDKPENLLVYNVLGRDVLSRRFYDEFPSPATSNVSGYTSGDMYVVLLMEKFFYRFHAEGTFEHRILVMYENGDNRMIGYGIKGDKALQLQKAAQVYEASLDKFIVAYEQFLETPNSANELEALSMESTRTLMGQILEKISNDLNNEYVKIMEKYYEDYCTLLEVKECLEPNFCDFMVDANLSEGIFVEDRGYFVRPKKH